MGTKGAFRLRAAALAAACIGLAAGCEVVDTFDRADAPLAGSNTQGAAALAWTTDGLTPEWRITGNHAGFASAGSPAKLRRAFVQHGAADVAVGWRWGTTSGLPAWSVSGLLHTDPNGGIDTGLRVGWYGGFILVEDGNHVASAPGLPAPQPGDTGRLEVIGNDVRYSHNGLAAIDWTTWSGQTTGYHGISAQDDGTAAALRKFDGVGFDVLAATDRPYYAPHDLDTTGATDETAALDAFVDSVPDGSTILLPPGATIWSQQLLLDQRSELTIQGNGSTLWQKAMPSGYTPVVHLRRGQDIGLRGLTVKGAFPDGGPGMFGTARGGVAGPYFGTDRIGAHGIRVEGVQTASIVDVHVAEVFGDGIYIGEWDDPTLGASAGPVGSVPSRDITVTGGSVRKNGRQGIAVVAAENTTIGGHSETNRYLITEIARSSVDLEPLGFWEYVDGVTLRHIELGTGSLTALAAAGDGPPRTRGAPADYTGQDELPAGLPATIDTQGEYLADPRGFRRVNNVTVSDWYLPNRPFWTLVGINKPSDLGPKRTSRRHGWSFEDIYSGLETGDRSNSEGALAVLWQVDDVHFDGIRARVGPASGMHFAKVDSGDGTPASGLTIGSDMDLAGTNQNGVPNGALAGDILYNGVTVNGPYP